MKEQGNKTTKLFLKGQSYARFVYLNTKFNHDLSKPYHGSLYKISTALANISRI